MTIVKWRDSYETGIEQMDKEHMRLIELINTLYQLMREKKSYDELKLVYESMLDYTEKHFQHEEEMLEKAGYPELEEQRASHAGFVNRLKGMEKDLVAAKESAAPIVYKFLREWWVDHIVGKDKLYGPFLKNK